MTGLFQTSYNICIKLNFFTLWLCLRSEKSSSCQEFAAERLIDVNSKIKVLNIKNYA